MRTNPAFDIEVDVTAVVGLPGPLHTTVSVVAPQEPVEPAVVAFGFPGGGYATALAKSGASPLATSRMLGHASVASTQAVYQHADEMVERAAQGLAEVFGA